MHLLFRHIVHLSPIGSFRITVRFLEYLQIDPTRKKYPLQFDLSFSRIFTNDPTLKMSRQLDLW